MRHIAPGRGSPEATIHGTERLVILRVCPYPGKAHASVTTPFTLYLSFV